MATRKSAPIHVKKNQTRLKKTLPYIYASLFVGALLFGGFYFVKYQQLNNKYTEATLTEDQRNERTTAAVAKLMSLPENEKPVLWAVGDKTKLGTSPSAKKFFEGIENGDVVLAYKDADKSIIYRPSEKRIIHTDSYTSFIAAANPIKVAIIAPAGQQEETEKAVYAKVLNIEVVGKSTPQVASEASYVADVSGSNGQAAQELATKLGLSVGQLPAEEKKPENGAVLVVVMATPVPAQ